jgi:hypothetical protein
VNKKRAQRMAERERTVGLEQDDEAAKWLTENAPEPEPPRPKAAHKSKALHRWRQQQAARLPRKR